jgi:ribulose-phosphate 3-epimerase
MSKHVRIIPAILTHDPKVLEARVRQAETFARYVQFDIMDVLFVPNRSVTCEDIAKLNTQLTWEAHLMVADPGSYLDCFKRAGAGKIVFHYEASPHPHEVISAARGLGLAVGLALNPGTPISSIVSLLRKVDSVLLLSVHPGFYGQGFLPEVLDKVTDLRRMQPLIEIGIDGGAKENNIIRIASSGVDAIYVGSAIFLQPVPGESYRRLQNLVDTALSDGIEKA